MTTFIDLNCDMGESFGAYKIGLDEEVIQLISSANIACGFHAGDPNVMDETVRMAKANGVGIGAHMGFPDLRGFGRRNMDIASEEIINDIIYQIGALQAFCQRHDVQIQHIKSHGNLANMSFVDARVANAITDAIVQLMPDTMLFVIENTELHKAAEAKGLKIVKEVFADRAYNKHGVLVSRKEEGAVIKDPDKAADNVLNMVLHGQIKTIEGETINIEAESICVHGDTEGALAIVRKVREKLLANNVKIAPIGQWKK